MSFAVIEKHVAVMEWAGMATSSAADESNSCAPMCK